MPFMGWSLGRSAINLDAASNINLCLAFLRFCTAASTTTLDCSSVILHIFVDEFIAFSKERNPLAFPLWAVGVRLLGQAEPLLVPIAFLPLHAILISMSFHTFGDSHSKLPFEQITGVCVHHVGPMLCYTVGRHKHNLTSLIDIRKDVKAGDVACFVFGEIDCRCHIHRFVTAEKTYKHVIDQVVNDYFIALMENEKLVPGVRMVVYNVVPPCSRANSPEDPVNPYAGSDEDRKTYALYFNDALKWNCNELGWLFLDVYDKYAGLDGFLSKDYSDGHVHITDPRFIKEFLDYHGLL